MTTYERMMQNEEQKKLFEKEYEEFLLSEFLLEAMEEEHKSVRSLSKESGVSTSIIQNIRSSKTDNVTLKTIKSIFSALGYELFAVKNEKQFVL